MIVNIHKIIYKTTAEGFGLRSCIWLQGCSRHCKGCMAKETWDLCGGTKMDTDDILENIFAQMKSSVFVLEDGTKPSGIEGVTFLGGEPFEQPKALAEMIQKIKEKDLSVIVFTGFTLEQLQKLQDISVHDCLKNIDLLIDGAYIEEKREFVRPWVGSSNQRFLFLTDRYSMKDVRNTNNRVEIRLTRDGKIQINGMADFDNILKEKGRNGRNGGI